MVFYKSHCLFTFWFKDNLSSSPQLVVEQPILNPWTYKQSHTPTVVQAGGGGVGGLMGPLPWVFAVFQYFGEILPLVESL